jgi:hypothetical protein
MNLRQFLAIMFFASVLCWAAWITVLFNIDPQSGSIIGFIFFYISFFLALFGTISLILFPFYYTFAKDKLPLYRYVQKSFRHSLVIAGILGTLLFLQGMHIFTLWNFSILVLASVSVFAFVFSMRKESY